MKRRFQNRIAESDLLLPIAAIGGCIYWCCTLGENISQAIGGLLLTALTSYFIMQLVAVYSLIRIRSRIVTGVFIFLMAGCVFLHTEIYALAATACLTLSLIALFHTYEDYNSTIDTLHAYVMLAVGALFYAPLIWATPVLLFAQFVFMRSLSLRTFGAALIGVCIPFWIWFCILLCLGNLTPIVTHLHATIPQGISLNLDNLEHQIIQLRLNASSTPLIMTLFILLLELTGIIHYTRNKYDDKIQVRTYYYTFLLLQYFFTIALILMPTQHYVLMPFIILSCAPTVGHFFALTHTILTNIWFVFCSLLYFSILILNNL